MKTGNGLAISSIQEPSTPPEEEPDDESQKEEKKQPLAVIPYVSEQIRKICEKFNLKVVFKSGLMQGRSQDLEKGGLKIKSSARKKI